MVEAATSMLLDGADAAAGEGRSAVATLHLSAQIWREQDAYVAHCSELRVTSEGDTFELAQQMLREAVELMLADMTPDEVAKRWRPTAWTGPLEVTVPEPLGEFHAA
jgi:predicted RNase H-like HicB family nuclease